MPELNRTSSPVRRIVQILLPSLIGVAVLSGCSSDDPTDPAASPSTAIQSSSASTQAGTEVDPAAAAALDLVFDGTYPSDENEGSIADAAETYRYILENWLSENGADTAAGLGLFDGGWHLGVDGDGGYVVFDGSEFLWYQSKDVLEDNYYQGYHAVLPGCELNTGITLESGGSKCYTVFFRYTGTMQDGVMSSEPFYGAWFVIEADGADYEMYNHRTSNTVDMIRAV